MIQKTGSLFAAFIRDKRGGALIYVTLLLPVLLGFGLLAVDGGRLFNLQTSLQAAADSFALAGAAELDGQAGAIDRANAAIDNMVENHSKFGLTGFATVTAPISNRRYLRELPPDDSEEIRSIYETTDDGEAAFVEVVVTPVTLATIFPLPNFAAASVATGARAVAGFSLTICKIVPIFMCNPYEGTSITLFEAAADPSHRRKQVHLRFLGPSAQYVPGNFAWLSVGCKGAKCLAENLAKTSPDTCYSARGVTTEPGQKQGAMAGLNVRFDLYERMMGGEEVCDELTGICSTSPSPYASDPDYAPAPNVRKGYYDGDSDPNTTCDQEALDPSPPPPGRLPRDDCYGTDPMSCPFDRLGDGVWRCQDYWDANFSDSGESPPAGCTNTPTISRYEMYQYEMANGLVAHQNSTPETGEPSCSLETPPSPDRRNLRGAIINCAAEGPLNGREEDVPVLAWAEFFLTEPVIRNGSDGDVYLELVRIVDQDPSDSGIHDEVQLYR